MPRGRLIAALFLVACARGGHGADPGAGGAPLSADSPRANPTTIDGQLDKIIMDGWGEIEPAPRVDDATFLRRVTLDLTGRIPTRREVKAFEHDGEPHKRRRVVNTLLASDAYAEHWAEVYTNLLYVGAARVKPIVRAGTRQWLEDQFGEGTSYDVMTRDMIASGGEFDVNGPYGFVLTHGFRNNIEGVTAHTARVFLGLRLECAQCHDHPTDDRLEQEDFYSMAAFYVRTKPRIRKGKGSRTPILIDKKRGEMRMPTAMDAPGSRSGPEVAPRFLGRKVQLKVGQTRREALADAIVDSDLFAKAVVARTWHRLMGHGLVAAFDDLGGEGDPSHPPALQHLADRFVASGYDYADLLRTIVLSTAYQRASFAPDRTPADTRAAEHAFAQAAVRPMDADQLFRSLLIATGVEKTAGRQFRFRVERKKKRALAEYKFVFPDDENVEADAFSGNVPQALLLLNGKLMARATQDRAGGTLAKILDNRKDPAKRVDALYVAVYGRHPTAAQLDAMVELVGRDGNTDRAYEDLMHAMLLSSEFLTIH